MQHDLIFKVWSSINECINDSRRNHLPICIHIRRFSNVYGKMRMLVYVPNNNTKMRHRLLFVLGLSCGKFRT